MITKSDVLNTGSVQEFAAKWQVEKTQAYGFIAFLEAKKVAKVVGKRPSESGKGKPTNIYSIPDNITLSL